MHSGTPTNDAPDKADSLARGAAGSLASAGLLGRIGALQVRLAETLDEVAAAQKLRYRVFHDELGAEMVAAESRDADRYDAVCDHLLVFDTASSHGTRIVGTYRLLRQRQAVTCGGFYSQDEFDLSELVGRHPSRNFLELGRSCVLAEYRTRRTVELLWQGIWAYCRRHEIDVMTGCASFPGIWPARHALALSFLHHHCRAEDEWRAGAHAHRCHSMDLMPPEAVEMRAALAAMPPLIKGYLRLGARFGEGCVIDREFRTTDVLVVLPTEFISRRYIDYYGAEAQRFSA